MKWRERNVGRIRSVKYKESKFYQCYNINKNIKNCHAAILNVYDISYFKVMSATLK